MDYMHPTMLEALRGHWPLIEPGTPPAEAQRVAADLDYQQPTAAAFYTPQPPQGADHG